MAGAKTGASAGGALGTRACGQSMKYTLNWHAPP